MLDGIVAAVLALQYRHMKNKVGAEVLPQRCASMKCHLRTQRCRCSFSGVTMQ